MHGNGSWHVQLDCACLLRRSRIKGWCETNLTILSVGQATKNIMNHRSANAVGVSHRGKEKKDWRKKYFCLDGNGFKTRENECASVSASVQEHFFTQGVCCSARSVVWLCTTKLWKIGEYLYRRSSDPYIRIESAVVIICFCVCGSVCACLCGTCWSCCHKDHHHHHHHHHHRYYHPCWIEPQRFVNVQGAKVSKQLPEQVKVWGFVIILQDRYYIMLFLKIDVSTVST